jgi:prolyl-tRNA synthetase
MNQTLPKPDKKPAQQPAKGKEKEGAITTRAADYAQWYIDIVRKAELADHSGVRGCMVIRPNGYAIWEKMQRELDDRFKATGHVNAYFPMFIPLSYLTKEEQHAAGFAKECASSPITD